jgi:hypothetical protein
MTVAELDASMVEWEKDRTGALSSNWADTA